MPITEAELSEIEKRANAATAGPWKHRPDAYDDWGTIRGADGLPVANATCEVRIEKGWRAENQNDSHAWHIGPPEVRANSEFIAHARTDIPKLIAAIRELQSQLNSKPRSRSKKQRVEEQLRASDLGAQSAGRDDIEWGDHETLPRGEHVMRMGKE